MKATKAFTLIELLVVIAIIAILAAILFPVFAQAKLSAKAISDLSNLKQVNTSLIMYTNDYDDMYTYATPESWSGAPSWGSASLGWTYNLQPYSKSLPLFRSPLDSSNQVEYPSWEGVAVSYGINSFTADANPAAVNFVGMTTATWGVRCMKGTFTNTPDCTLRGISAPFAQINGQDGGELNVGALLTTQVTHPGDTIALATKFDGDARMWGGPGNTPGAGNATNFQCGGYFDGVNATNGNQPNGGDYECGGAQIPNGLIPTSVLPPLGPTGAVGQVKQWSSNFSFVDGHAKFLNIGATDPNPDTNPGLNKWDALRP